MASELPDDILGVDEDGDGGGGDDGEDVEYQRMVVFRIGSVTYAAQVDAVRTVVEPTDLTDVPRSSPAIEGVMDLRGDITAVIDPHVHFADLRTDETDQRVVVIDRGPDRQAAGLLVDEVSGVESIPAPYFYDVEDEDAETEPFRRVGELVVATIQRPDDEGGTERIGVLDTEAVVQASTRQNPESSA